MFTKDLTRFLADLGKHNDKEWFAENKARYEESYLEPAREFIRAMEPRLAKISKHLTADDRKSGGSMMRIYRDVRFGKDKRPYNEHLSMVFHHAVGKKVPAPGYYLRITAEGATLGAGIWQPETAAVAKIREHIVKSGAAWKKARDDAAQKRAWGKLVGESLKRPPRGFDAEHPLIEDLKRKDFVLFREVSAASVSRKDFADKTAEAYAKAKPLMRFVCKSLDLPF